MGCSLLFSRRRHQPQEACWFQRGIEGTPGARSLNLITSGHRDLQVQKISLLTPNIGVVYSGMGPDSRVLVRKARKQAQAYYRLYHEHIPVAQLVRETAAVMQEFTRARTAL